MIKKLLLILFIPCAILFADNSDASIWIQMNNTLALNLDLAKTIKLPTKGTNWPHTGYNNDNYLAKIGSNGISSPVYLDVTCNYTDDEGHFIMVSQSSNGLIYRTFKLGMAYRAKVTYQNDHANYYPDENVDTSFFEFDTNGPAPYPLPSLGAVAIDVDKGQDPGTIKYSWMDFLIMLDDYKTNGDKAHLNGANDYKCIVTVTAHTEDNRFSQSLNIPLQGYFESHPDELAGTAFLSLENYGTILDLRNMTTNDFVDIGYVDFSTTSFSKTSKKSFDITVSPSDIVTDSDKFLMKRMTGRSVYDHTNSVPIRIRLLGDTVVGTTYQSATLDTATSRTVRATQILQNAPDQTDTQNYGYNATIQASLDPDYDIQNLESLLSGQYYCDLYFLVTINE